MTGLAMLRIEALPLLRDRLGHYRSRSLGLYYCRSRIAGNGCSRRRARRAVQGSAYRNIAAVTGFAMFRIQARHALITGISSRGSLDVHYRRRRSAGIDCCRNRGCSYGHVGRVGCQNRRIVIGSILTRGKNHSHKGKRKYFIHEEDCSVMQ